MHVRSYAPVDGVGGAGDVGRDQVAALQEAADGAVVRPGPEGAAAVRS